MILDENLFGIKEARGSKEGVKRGPYNKEKSKSKEDLYDELQDRLEKEFYFPGVAKGGDLKVNLIMKDENKAELKGKKPARLIASSMSKYRDIKDEKELDTAKKIAKEMGFKTELDKTKRVPTLIIKLEESLNEKKSNRLTYHEFVDYLDSIDNGYTGFAKVTGNKGSGYRYTLSNKLTREQHDYLAQYDNVDFGIAQYRYAPEIKHDTVILLDKMSKTSSMKEDYDEDFFYTYEAIRYGESDPNRKYSGNFENYFDARELAEDDGYDEVVRHTYDFISDNFDDYYGKPPRRTDTIWTRKNGYLNEDIIKTSKGKWVNKGKEGTHGEFTTKKKAREQQKAMFASGWKGESLDENIGSDIAEYQKWVDYDMKKYGRISSLTNHKVRKAGLKIVKDKYGDYEVIANEPIREDTDIQLIRKFYNEKIPKNKMELRHKLKDMGLEHGVSGVYSNDLEWVELNGKRYEIKKTNRGYSVNQINNIKEDLEREFTIHYNREGFEFGGYGAVRVKATNEHEAKEKFYAEKKDDKITISSIRPTENEDIRKGIRLLETKKVEESLKNNEVADFFDKAKKLGVKTLKDLKILLAQPESKGDSEKEKLDNYSKEANPDNKDLSEDVEVVDKNQAEIDKKAGLENLLNDLINDENEAINGYNSAIVNFELEGKSDLTNVFRDIIKDEQNHIGNLQKVLNEINPTTIANLEQGQEEAADTLNK